ncbi:PREDICTED: uncharacterized protein LOC107356548 [Acropora digitifera]|uniref:uncharacterized protein LOC107356548 n=1 Tax=Acropora digitifera TaxID=70779 RepID=UPI000779F3EC|nr:PREDICTED: uncharacterized protein LOC107356548 [Acropora digitifera]
MCHVAYTWYDIAFAFYREGWATCPPGHIIRGLHRGSSNQLRSIQWVTCCKPAFQPHRYRSCYDQDLGGGDKWECNRDGYYLAGIHRGASESLSSIDRFRCCSFYDKILPLKNLDEVKTRIMDVTLFNLALLANFLGYGWAGGCRGRIAGEDFLRDGDSWKSHYQRGCAGYMSTSRLKIVYDNFGFKVKKMDYSEAETQSIKPIVQDKGEIKNQDSNVVESTIKRQIKTVRTVIHSSSTRFKTTIGASLTLSYQSPGVIGEVATGTFKASFTLSGGKESAQVQKEANGDIKWEYIKVKESQTTEPNSGTSYRITTSQTRYNVPYKAVIQVQFSARLEGFLIWGGGPNGKNPNYHEKWRGSGDRPTFNYDIGSGERPFFKHLKQISDRGEGPWLWHLLKQNIPYTETVLGILTDESLYEFELEGKFEDVAGLQYNVVWDDVPISSANSTLRF